MKGNAIHESFCPACGGDIIAKKWEYHKNSDNFHVFWCGGCGFGWRYPFPGQEELKKKYFTQSLYELAFKNESNVGFEKRVKRLCEIMPTRGRLLDIGSGPGHFLNIAKEYGWQVEGIEPRQEASEFCCKNFGILSHAGFFEDVLDDLGHYEVITCWDVLEHVSDHVDFLDRCLALLVPGGLFAFSIPNASGLPAFIFKGRWRYVMSVHLNYFTMEYIHELLCSKGTQIVHEDHTFKLHSLVQGVVSYLPLDINVKKLFKSGLRNDDHGKKERIDTDRPINFYSANEFLYYCRKLVFKINMLSLPFGKGDIVDIYCRKKSL